MHEMSLAEGIRGIVEDQAKSRGFGRVTRMRLEIGRFAGVEKEALAFAFDVVMRGSPAEGAALEMIDLLLKLCRVGPEIVPFANGDVLASGFRVQLDHIGPASGLAHDGDHILAITHHQPDPVGMRSNELFADLTRTIRAAILTDQDLPRRIELLGQDAREALRDVGRVPVRGHDHAHERFERQRRVER